MMLKFVIKFQYIKNVYCFNLSNYKQFKQKQAKKLVENVHYLQEILKFNLYNQKVLMF